MKLDVRCASGVVLILLLTASMGRADNPVNWLIVEQVNRTDTTKTWQSPTAIDLGKMVWEYDYEITKLTGTVSLPLGGSFTQDVTSSLPPEVRTASGETRILPAVLVNQTIVEAGTGSSADVFVEIDAQGFGRAVFSNIMLGSIDVPLLGSRPIQRINIEAAVSVVGYDFGDYNRDGRVDAADYVVWRRTLGQTGDALWADGNWNDTVDAGDYDVWRENFARTAFSASAAGSLSPIAVPEPTSAALLLLLPLATRRFDLARARRPRCYSGSTTGWAS